MKTIHRQQSAGISLDRDMIMDPGIDGLETFQRILEIHPGQKASIVSGFSETDRIRQARELGAGSYVMKPYRMEKIGLAVRTELDKRCYPIGFLIDLIVLG